jgi:hypothetical protein
VGIDPNARNVHEQAIVDLSNVERSRLRGKRVGKRSLRTHADAQLARETVSRAGWNDSERHVVERQCGRDLVDRSVAAPRDDKPRATLRRSLGKLTRMARTFRDEHLRRISMRFDDGQSSLSAGGGEGSARSS